MEIRAKSAEARAAEAERHAEKVAEKLFEISTAMTSGKYSAKEFCRVCNICPEDEDTEMEGYTCLDAINEWAAREEER